MRLSVQYLFPLNHKVENVIIYYPDHWNLQQNCIQYYSDTFSQITLKYF